MTTERTTADPHRRVNGMLVSLRRFVVHLIIRWRAAQRPSAVSLRLHPVTRLMVRRVRSAGVGDNPLRRDRRDPSRAVLARVQGVAIGTVLAMLVAARLRCADGRGGVGPERASFAPNALALFDVGAVGLFFGRRLLDRSNPAA